MNVNQLFDNNSINSLYNTNIIDCSKTKKLNNNYNNYKQESLNGKSSTIKNRNRKYTNTNNTNEQFDVTNSSFTHIRMYNSSEPNKYYTPSSKTSNYNNKGSLYEVQSFGTVYESKPRKFMLDSFSKPRLK